MAQYLGYRWLDAIFVLDNQENTSSPITSEKYYLCHPLRLHRGNCVNLFNNNCYLPHYSVGNMKAGTAFGFPTVSSTQCMTHSNCSINT